MRVPFHGHSGLVFYVSRIEHPTYLKFKETTWASNSKNMEDKGQGNEHCKNKGKGKGKGNGEGADKDENTDDGKRKDNNQEKVEKVLKRLASLI